MSLLELRLRLGLLHIQNQVSKHEKDDSRQIGEAPDTEPESRQVLLKGNAERDTYAERDKKEDEIARGNQEYLDKAFEHGYCTERQRQVEINREIWLIHHQMHC